MHPPASQDHSFSSASPTVELTAVDEDHQMATHINVSGTSNGNDYPQNADDYAGTTNPLGEPNSSYSLPPFTKMQDPSFQWGARDRDSFRGAVDLAYAEVRNTLAPKHLQGTLW